MHLPCRGPLDVTKWLIDFSSWFAEEAKNYADVAIAVFTAAAVMIAIIQIRHELSGSILRYYFPIEQVPLIGPTYLRDTFVSATAVAIFFEAPIVFINEGPRAGVIAQLSLKLLTPDPDLEMKRQTGEIDAFKLQFRFDSEKAVNAPLGALTIEGNSARAIKVTCAIVKTNLTPGSSTPPASDMTKSRIKLQWTCLIVGKKKKDVLKMTAVQEYNIIPALYDQAIIKEYRDSLKL